jgi:type I pantothenate kinase
VEGLHRNELRTQQEVAAGRPAAASRSFVPGVLAALDFDRAQWAALRAATPLTLSEADLAELRGLNDRVSLAEVEVIYLPLSRLLNLHVAAIQTLHQTTDTFLGTGHRRSRM